MAEERHTFLGTVFTCLTGAAIGAGLALLFAPQTGEETRKKIKDISDKLADDAKDNYEKITKEAQKAIESVKETSDKAVDQVKTFIDSAKEGFKKELEEAKAEVKEAAPAKK